MNHPLRSTKNNLRQKLSDSSTVVYGIFFYTGDSSMSEAAATTGLDFMIIDMEASPMTSRDVIPILQSLNGSACSSIVRVPRHDQQLIGHALDIGADGVMIPKVESASDSNTYSSALRYPPLGTRGVNSLRASAYGAIDAEYMSVVDSEALCVVQIESAQAVINAGQICSEKNVDIVFIGIGDLTLSSGVYGQIDHPDIVKARKHVLEQCRLYNKIPGIFAGSAEIANKFVAEGFRFIAIGNDIKHFKSGLDSVLMALDR